MKNKLVYRGIVFLTIVLFVGASVASGFYTNSINNPKLMSRGWLYVGGSGPGNYTTIQSAIDAASSGDTIFVYNGIYQEDLTINYKTNVQLIGESMNNVILKILNYNALVVLGCTDVTIKNFYFLDWYFAIYNDNLRVKVSNLYVNTNGLILGIEMFWGSQDCEIYNCYVTNSTYGIWVPWAQGNPDSTNTHIYHNNMFGNTNCASDDSDGSSIWEYNYYDDYTGVDSDGDGIGDTPYDIPGTAGNQDLYPLMRPWGENLPVANFTYTPSNRTFDGSSSYDRDGIIILYEWDFGDGTTGKGMVTDHTYSQTGTYDVTLTVTDNNGYKDNVTKTIEVEVINYPPEAPIINGLASGKAGKSYPYTFVSEDPDDDDVYYQINWGDGIVEGWFGPNESNEIIIKSHTWSEKGTYTIMARAKDVYGAIGDWGTFTVTMPKNKAFNFNHKLLDWLFERYPNAFRMLRHLTGLY